MEKSKKLMVAMMLISLVLSCSNTEKPNLVDADAFDCFDACITGCVQQNTRLMRRCEGKCSIKCNRTSSTTMINDGN
ncbi:hypothetical protein LINPERPRIM_LOCUS27003 [Linum perenne]